MPDDLYSTVNPEAGYYTPLLRLRQLAQEIRAAIDRNDLEVICQAASLLPSALVRWNDLYPTLPVGAGDAAQIALDTLNLLNECETVLTQAMQRVREEMRYLNQGKKMLAHSRSRRAELGAGRTLDTNR